MKRVGYLLDQVADLDNLYLAYAKAIRGKQCRHEVLRYGAHLEENLALLRTQILTGEVDVGHYRFFTLYDPKERTICAAPLAERVLQHALMNVCHPIFDGSLIDTTYATRKGKGVYAALEKAVSALGHYHYCVKLDVRKYYDSIDHEVLKALLRRKIKDPTVLRIFDAIIDSYQVAPGKGLPIGNLTSQYFANAYLSPLDHRAKELWKAQVYIRYMDDIFIAGDDRAALVACVEQMVGYATEALRLTFKPPIYRRRAQGQVFLGYKVLPHHTLLSGRSKRRFRSKLILYHQHYEKGRWGETQYQEHLMPLLAFVQKAKSTPFRKACLAAIG